MLLMILFYQLVIFQLNDEQEKNEDEKFLAELEELEDEFLKEYRLKRLEEMRKALAEV